MVSDPINRLPSREPQTSLRKRKLRAFTGFNPLNAELNTICHLLALLGGATIVVVSRLRVNDGLSSLRTAERAASSAAVYQQCVPYGQQFGDKRNDPYCTNRQCALHEQVQL